MKKCKAIPIFQLNINNGRFDGTQIILFGMFEFQLSARKIDKTVKSSES